jgi:hypothetical protein
LNTFATWGIQLRTNMPHPKRVEPWLMKWPAPWLLAAVLAALLTLPLPVAAAASLARSLETIRAVGPEGKGNAEAGAAWKSVSTEGGGALITILKAMNGANDLAVNWLRAAVDTIAARELASQSLPVAALEGFVKDTGNNPQARRLAYEWLARADATAGERLIAGMLNDPGRELRRDAVQRQLDAALAVVKSGQSNEALPKFQALLPSARDVDHVEIIARNLKALGQPVDVPKIFGWLSEWKVIGPFDSTRGTGFDKVYPPEQRVDLAAEYNGKDGAKVRWQDQEARGDLGLVDLNKPCGTLKGVAGYAYREFEAEKAGPVELRLGCENAWKIWVNGRFLFGRDEYHRGMEVDQYRLATELKKGRNTILVKLCQDEMKEEWTKGWEFQLRITDSLGAPIAGAKK